MHPSDDSRSGWIFVSHSTKDIDAVYHVRNVLEGWGHHPLLFFLRCLQEREELSLLLRREIEARNFFLYCDSVNARASHWVQQELAFIRSLPDRRVDTVDITANPEEQLRSMRRLSRAQTLFLSYAHRNEALVAPIRRALIDAEYRIWEAPVTDFSSGFLETIEGGILDALEDGFVLVFLSGESLGSAWAERETAVTLERLKHHPRSSEALVPIVLEPLPALTGEFGRALESYRWLDVSGLPPNEAGGRIIKHLRRR